jgi:uncharacterized protein YxeA
MIKRIVASILILLIIYIGLGIIFEPKVFLQHTKWILEGQKKEEGTIKETIILYNKIFTDLYASNGQPLRLNDFPAVKRLRHELYRDLDFLRARGLLLVYDMADLTFIEIKRPFPLTAEVVTFEEWNYIYQKSPSRETAQSIKGMGQGFKYFIQKQKGQWVVVDCIPVNVKPPERKDEFKY